jgi:hypothetical protein
MHDVVAGEMVGQASSTPVLTRLAALLRPHGQRKQEDSSVRRPVLGEEERRQDALAVLSAARVVVQRGWVQDVWYVLKDPRGRLRSFGPMTPIRLDHREVVRACLVGAVVQAAWQQSRDSERSGPALDALWDGLQQARGFGGPEGLSRMSSPAVRAARVRDLTRWNDCPDRTREDVLELLDGTVRRLAQPQTPPGPSTPAKLLGA